MIDVSLQEDPGDLNVYSWISLMRANKFFLFFDKINDDRVFEPEGNSLFFFSKPDEMHYLKQIVKRKQLTFSTTPNFVSIGNSRLFFDARLSILILSCMKDIITFLSKEQVTKHVDKFLNDAKKAHEYITLTQDAVDVSFLKEYVQINSEILQAMQNKNMEENGGLWKEIIKNTEIIIHTIAKISFQQSDPGSFKEYFTINADILKILQRVNFSNQKAFVNIIWKNLYKALSAIIKKESGFRSSKKNALIQQTERNEYHALFLVIPDLIIKQLPTDDIELELSDLISSYTLVQPDSALTDHQNKFHLKLLTTNYNLTYSKYSEQSYALGTSVRVNFSQALSEHIITENYDLKEDFLNDLMNIRKELKEKYAVSFPAVILKDSYYLTGKQFFISIREVPPIFITIPEGKKHTTLPPATLDKLNIVYQQEANKSANLDSSWIDSSIQIPDEYGLAIQDEKKYIIWYMKNYLAGFLWQFMDMQQLHDRTNELENLNASVKSYLLSPENRVVLLQVLRGLLTEQVPIPSFEASLLFISKMLNRDIRKISSIISELRKSDDIIEWLPGNDHSFTHLNVSQPTEMLINSTLIEAKNGEKILCIETNYCEKALSHIRTLVSGVKKPCLVIKNEHLRTHFSDLIKREFPFVPVLSTSELLPYLKIVAKDAIASHISEYQH